MNIIQNATLGFYCPNFFRLHIRTSNSIDDLNQLNDTDFSVFLHEYIHFLQNITTVYGLNNIHTSVEYMRYANCKIIADKKTQFNIPIIPDEDNSLNVNLNCYLSKITYGEVGDDSTTIEYISNYTISNEQIPINNSQIKEIESVCVEFQDNNESKNCFSFGAGCIMESMAYLMETLTCPNYKKSSNLPYETATLLTDFIYPEFAQNKLNILALCDISLFSTNPAVYFVRIIEDWKQKKKIPSTPKELYSDCCKLNPDLIKNLYNVADIAKLQLKGYFNDSYFNPIKEWAETTINTALELRKDNPFFILDIANGNIRYNHIFCDILKTIGTPILTNDNGFAGCYHSNIDIQQQIGNFWAISEIYNIFYTGTFTSCKLINCCQNIPNAVDCRCSKTPWKRSKDKHLCSFALFWHHWGLDDYEPICKSK